MEEFLILDLRFLICALRRLARLSIENQKSLILISHQLDLDAHAFEGDAGLVAVAQYLAHPLLLDLGAGDEDFLDALLLADAAQVAVAAEDAQAVDDLALLERVVVHEADRRVLEPEVVAHLA